MWTPSHVSQARSCGFDCTAEGGRRSRGGAIILLGATRHSGLFGRVLLAAVTKISGSEKVFEFDLSAYPQWLVVAAATVVVALVVWILIKLLKWTLWLLFFAVLIGGFAWAGWLAVQ